MGALPLVSKNPPLALVSESRTPSTMHCGNAGLLRIRNAPLTDRRLPSPSVGRQRGDAGARRHEEYRRIGSLKSNHARDEHPGPEEREDVMNAHGGEDENGRGHPREAVMLLKDSRFFASPLILPASAP